MESEKHGRSSECRPVETLRRRVIGVVEVDGQCTFGLIVFSCSEKRKAYSFMVQLFSLVVKKGKPTTLRSNCFLL